MNDYQQKPNTGAIFKNDRKENEKQPDYSGTINVEGQDFSIALWVKEGKKGKFFSASIKQKEDKPNTGFKKKSEPVDDMPF